MKYFLIILFLFILSCSSNNLNNSKSAIASENLVKTNSSSSPDSQVQSTVNNIVVRNNDKSQAAPYIKTINYSSFIDIYDEKQLNKNIVFKVLSEPSFSKQEGNHELWRYDTNTCKLFVYFSKENVVSLKAYNLKGENESLSPCLKVVFKEYKK